MDINQYLDLIVIVFLLVYIAFIRYNTSRIMPTVGKVLLNQDFVNNVYQSYKVKILTCTAFSTALLIFICIRAFFLMSSLQVDLSLSVGLCVFVGFYAVSTNFFYISYKCLFNEYEFRRGAQLVGLK